MSESAKPLIHERWAHLRFSVVGPLLAAPPARGELQAALEVLAAKPWLHPVTGTPTRFGLSTLERWYSAARRATVDPVGVLRRKVRSDAGQQTALGEKLKHAVLEQYAEHPRWSYALHYGNLAARVRTEATLGPVPSYASIRRFMKAHGLLKRRRFPDTPGGRRAAARLEEREVRSFEAEHVHGLWHLDFHHGSKKVLTPAGEWVTPLLLGVLDDRSRLACPNPACRAHVFFVKDGQGIVVSYPPERIDFEATNIPAAVVQVLSLCRALPLSDRPKPRLPTALTASVRGALTRYVQDIRNLPNEAAKASRLSGLVSQLFPGTSAPTELAAEGGPDRNRRQEENRLRGRLPR